MPAKRLAEEYPPKSGILIAQKINPAGSRAYRVDIAPSLTGSIREQRQFPTREEALGYAKTRHAEILRLGYGAFTLSDDQRHEALKALAILESYDLGLVEAVRIATTHVRCKRERLTVSELYARFIASPGKRRARAVKRQPLTIHNLTWRLNRFANVFGERQSAEITTSDVQGWLNSLGNLSAISFNNYRRVLHALFGFGVSEGYLSSNPVARIPLYVVPHKNPAILTVEQSRMLLSAAESSDHELGLLAYVALGLFAGLRRAEMERLEWTAVKWDRKLVTVDATIAKSGSIRNVMLPDNAVDWLKRCLKQTGKVTPPQIKTSLRKLWKLAGFQKEGRNELRHSFASYHYDLHQNAPLTAAQLGHSSGTNVLFTHYRSLVALGEGREFFKIIPK